MTDKKKGMLILCLTGTILLMSLRKSYASLPNSEKIRETDALKMFVDPVKQMKAEWQRFKEKQAADDLGFYADEMYTLNKDGDKIEFISPLGKVAIIYYMLTGDLDVLPSDTLAGKDLQEAIGILGKDRVNQILLKKVGGK